MVEVPRLHDGDVTLRQHRDDDLGRVVEQSNDEQSIAWTRVPVPYGLDDAKRFVRHAMPGGWATGQEWGFAVEHEARYAGTVSLRDRGDSRAEVAFGAHPDARGRGVMERALRLLLPWGFEEMGVQSVLWLAHRGNWPSRRLAWRLGFSIDGTVSQWLVGRDGLLDAWVGSLRAGEPLLPRHVWYDAPRITGSSVVLRSLRDDDVERMYESCIDEQTSYWLGGMPAPYTRDDAREFIARCREQMAGGRALHWTMADPRTDVSLGVLSLMQREPDLDLEVGYSTHPDARRRGVTTEAVRLAVRHAFVPLEDGGLGRPRVTGYAAAGNVASRRVLEAAGFAPTGVQRLATVVRDGRHDLAGYDLLATDVVP